MMLNGMALFAGIGGIEIGLRNWVRTVCYVEKEPYAAAVIRSRIRGCEIDDAPIWDDVCSFKGYHWRGKVDVISGGFPCQDISTAGKGRGIKKDTRSGLWFEMLRIINEVRPSIVFVENVSAITNRGLDIVLGCLSEAGYDARWTDLRASDVGARHRRERMFILAYSECSRHIHGQAQEQSAEAREHALGDIRPEGDVAFPIGSECGRKSACGGKPQASGSSKDVADNTGDRYINGKGTFIKGSVGFAAKCGEDVADTRPDACGDSRNKRFNRQDERIRLERKSGRSSWTKDPAENDPSSESFVGRVADGIPNRVDRIKCLGNAVVPSQAEKAWEILTNVRK